MKIDVRKVPHQEDTFCVEITGQVSCLFSQSGFSFNVNSKELDNLCFQGNAILQDTEREVKNGLS